MAAWEKSKQVGRSSAHFCLTKVTYVICPDSILTTVWIVVVNKGTSSGAQEFYTMNFPSTAKEDHGPHLKYFLNSSHPLHASSSKHVGARSKVRRGERTRNRGKSFERFGHGEVMRTYNIHMSVPRESCAQLRCCVKNFHLPRE